MPALRMARMTALASLLLGAGAASAQVDVPVFIERDFGVQQRDGQLVVGLADLDANSFSYPDETMILTRNFQPGDPNSSTRRFPFTNEPGFFTLPDGFLLSQATPAAGPLPADAPLSWDYLPMVVDGVSSNLFYWDGLDDGGDGITSADVDFATSTGVGFAHNTSRFSTPGSGFAIVFGTDEMIEGRVIAETEFDGSIHQHGQFQVFPSDGSDAPPEGVYMVSMQVRMPGFETSDPFFLAMRTSTIDVMAEAAAEAWIRDNLDMLLGSAAATPGDYDGNGFVDAADLAVWQQEFGLVPANPGEGADGNADGIVDGADYALWRNSLPPQAPGLAAAAAPEPTAAVLLAVLAGVAAGGRPRCRA